MEIKKIYETQNILGITSKGRPLTEEAKSYFKNQTEVSIEQFAACKNCGLIFNSTQSTFPCVNCGNLDFEIKTEVI